MWSNDIHECVHIYVHTNSLRGIFLIPSLTSYNCPVCSVLFASKLYLRDICQSFTFFYMSKQVWRQAFYTIWRKSLLKYKYISVYINIYTVYINSPSLHSSTENKLLEPGVSPTSIPAKWSPVPFTISLQAVSLRVVLADLNLFAREFVGFFFLRFFDVDHLKSLYWICYSIVAAAQSLSRVWLFATPWAAACQASLSFTISWSLLKLMSIELVIPSNHLILCHPLLLLPSIVPIIRVLSNELALCIR